MAITEVRKQELLDAIAAHKAEKASLSVQSTPGISKERKAQLDAILANHKVETVTTPAPEFLDSLGSSIIEQGQSFIEKEMGRLGDVAGAAKDVLTGQIPVTQVGNILKGQVAGVVNDIAGAFIAGVGSTWFKQQPVETREAITSTIQEVADTKVPGTEDTIKDSVAKLVITYETWAEKNPEQAIQTESVANVLSLVPLGAIGEATGTAARRVAAEAILSKRGVAQLPSVAGRTTGRIVEGSVVGATEVTARAATTTGKGVISETLAAAKRTLDAIPARIETNRAAMEAERLFLEPLPQVERDALTNGVSKRDVNLSRELSQTERTVAKTMVQHAEQFGVNRAAQDPAELVGREVTTRLSDVSSIAEQQGQKLGELVSLFPKSDLSGPVLPSVFARLQTVNGLKGLALDEDGLLDFSRTVLAARLSKEEKAMISSVYKDIIGMDAEQLHLYRQQLFDVLDGKGKAGLVMNGTEPKALNAIRQGIADVLEETVPGYKALNQRNAELLGLLARYRKYFKGMDNAPEDIMDARGAVLARRLTSNAPSGQDLLLLFKETENVLSKYGIIYDVNIANLQDVLNAIERYFDITKDTGLAGQIRVSVDDIKTSLTGAVIGKAQEFAGQTKEVTRDAFKRLFEDVPGEKNVLPSSSDAKPNNPDNAVPDGADKKEGNHIQESVPQELVKKTTPKPKATPKPKTPAKKAVKAPTAEQSLLSEAKKYKAADEFVAAQFNKKSEYAMSHRPSWEGMPPASNLTEGDAVPKDVYEHPEWSIASGRNVKTDKSARESWDALLKVKGKPDAELTVYRATRKNELNTGDWISLSKNYAEDSIEGDVEKVFTFKIKASDAIFAGDDINEFGYYPKSQLLDIYKKAHGK